MSKPSKKQVYHRPGTEPVIVRDILAQHRRSALITPSADERRALRKQLLRLFAPTHSA